MTAYKIKALKWLEISDTFYTSSCGALNFNVTFEFEKWWLYKYRGDLLMFSIEVASKKKGMEAAEKEYRKIVLEYLEEV